MDLLVWVVVILVPAFLFFFHLKQMAHGSETVSLASGNFQMTIPSNRFLSIALDRSGWRAEKSITVLNAPAKFVEIVVFSTRVTDRKLVSSFLPTFDLALPDLPHLCPTSVVLCRTWVDALLGRSRIRQRNMILSLILALASAVLCCGFRFGIS